jgi:hypothetical protein
MIVWKVVSKDEFADEWVSWTTFGLLAHTDAWCFYTIEVPTFPNTGCGPLAAFRTRAQARSFRRIFGVKSVPSAILKCEAVESSSSNTCLYFPGSGSIEELRDSMLPEGTVFCDSITPIAVAG